MEASIIPYKIARAIDECYEDPRKARRISLRKLNEDAGRPRDLESLNRTLAESKEAMRHEMDSGRIVHFKVMSINAGGPEWIRFSILPKYDRPSTNPEPRSVQDA